MLSWKETRERIQSIIVVDLPEEWQVGANLSEANLSGADLSEANLSGAIGIVAIHFAGFSMYVQSTMARIGCKYMSHEDWRSIDLDRAVKMGIKAEHYPAYVALFEAAVVALNA